MRDLIDGFCEQLEEALVLSSQLNISESENDIYNIVICGLGGSGIGGSIVKSIVQDEIEIPISLIKTYDLPNFVGPNSLVVCSSFSGNTEETLSAYHQAKDSNAKVLCITSGGTLKELAEENNDDLAILPDTIQSPRANIGYSVIQLLYALYKYEFISDSFIMEIENSIKLLSSDSNLIQEESLKLANAYVGSNVILYSGDRSAAITVRCQQQINENGKQFCHVSVFPESNHNELVGWEKPNDFYENTLVTYIVTDFDHARVRYRMNICENIFANNTKGVLKVHAKGNSYLEQVFYLINLFDYVSVDLAVLNNVDPTSIDNIDLLKGELSKL